MCVCVCYCADRQITELYNESVTSIRDSNKWDEVRPAFTCDLWRSRTRREYFTLTMHYIDVKRDDSGTRWHLRTRILGSVPVQAINIDHEGDKQCGWPAMHGTGWCGRLLCVAALLLPLMLLAQTSDNMLILWQWSLGWHGRS